MEEAVKKVPVEEEEVLEEEEAEEEEAVEEVEETEKDEEDKKNEWPIEMLQIPSQNLFGSTGFVTVLPQSMNYRNACA